MGQGPCKSEHRGPTGCNQMPEMSRALLRNLLALGKRENACSFAHGVLVFLSSPAIAPAAACEVPCPVSYFRRGGVKESAFANTRFFLSLPSFSFYLFFLPPCFPLDLPTANFSSIRARCGAASLLRCFLT